MTATGEKTSPDGRSSNEFSGSAGPVVQAGQVFGNVLVHAAAKRGLPTPRQLPPVAGHFVNREAAVRWLDQYLGDHSKGLRTETGSAVISAVSGPAGIGKTTLVLYWAHRVRDQFPDGDLYADLRGHAALPPARPENVLEDFLRALGVPSSRIPASVDGMSALYRSLLTGRRVLIVLDNASTPDQVRPLLPGSSHSMVVVTSRKRLSGLVAREGARRVTLSPLSMEDSLALLRSLIGEERVDREREIAEQIIALCSFLPLALRIVADRALLRPDDALRVFLDELAAEKRLLDALATNDELSEVRAVLSWSYRSLEPEAARLFKLLADHPGSEISVEAACALSGSSEWHTLRMLDSINEIHLIDRINSRRYQMHDLVKAYASERADAECDPADRAEAVRRMFAWYLARAYGSYKMILPQGRPIDIGSLADSMNASTFRDIDEALAWCDVERSNVLACVEQAEAVGEFAFAWKLALAFIGYLERRSYWSAWIESHEIAIRSAGAIGDLSAQSFALMLQGDAYWDRRDFDEALARYTKAIEVSRTARDRWTEGFALRGCSLTHLELGNYQDAVRYSSAAYSIFVDIGELRGQGMTLLSLGNAYRELRDFEAATRHYNSAIRIFTQLGNEWSVGLASYHSGLADTLSSDHHAALRNFDRALEIFRKLGDRRHEAWVLRDMAPSLGIVRSSDAARESRERALEILTQLNDPEADELRSQLRQA